MALLAEAQVRMQVHVSSQTLLTRAATNNYLNHRLICSDGEINLCEEPRLSS